MSVRPTEWLTQSVSRYPERFLLGLIFFCLFVFLLAIPAPRIDNQLVGSDGIRNYVYLPSLLLDRDLDFTDEYAYFYAYDPDEAEKTISDSTSRGVPANGRPIGPAILWAPFFLLAHLMAHLFNLLGANMPTDGYSYFYQALVLSGSILYGGAGLLLTYRQDRVFASLGFLGFAAQWYVISSWHNWVQGDAFGGRIFIVCTPIFALGLAHLIEWTQRRWSWSVVHAIGGLLLVLNFLLFVEYRFDLVTAQRPPTWYDLTIRRVTFLVYSISRIWK